MKNCFIAGTLVLLFAASSAFVDAGTPEATFSVPGSTTAAIGSGFTVTTSMDVGNSGPVQGWSYSLCHTGSLATVDSVDDADTATVKNGSPADFNEISTYADGFTQGVVICFTGCATIAEGTTGFGMATGNYTATTEGSGTIEFCETLGSPPTATVVVINSASIPPFPSNGTLDVVGIPDPNPYTGGDCNGDSAVDISDVIFSLSELFGMGPSANCGIACDANGDGIHDAGDAVYTATYIFLSGPAPSGPADCDVDVNQVFEDCESDNCL